ncbi:TraY domain-containing protein [Plesiomonas shigelloides]|uniref:TraY domain-containing protein n=1 Tax=Plesiomonas shigelloides TaxID=703 RepID=UPI0012624582|nr:TraY domain-containing protein [Plesiomonas shigelloides]KAB7680209.1 TraY domain-containing protein [Plesiomonas shigelloides]
MAIKKKSYIQVELDKDFDELLEKAIEISGRTKRKEAIMRLKDHLQRYPTITAVGIVEEKQY